MQMLAWRLLVIVALIAMNIWGRGVVAGLRKEARIGREDIASLKESLKKLDDGLPILLRYELARHKRELTAWMEANHDCEER